MYAALFACSGENLSNFGNDEIDVESVPLVCTQDL